ncbi:lysozyme-like isoform X2 [Galleria mellonella]|uniref:Lysozyme n=1 Tax=Galleria mellonella TaxID=7137 RepID=A0ABM3MB94_GALME|nr:lysozyme-like isoform X2 [Galleria mellonella]
MYKNIVTAIISMISICQALNKTFTQCELAIELKTQGFPENQLKDWVCIVEAESSRHTFAIGGPDEDGSFDYGLFQINDRYWCNNGSNPGKGCNVRCRDLLSDDITTASICAKTIYKQQNFSAWLGWVNECHHHMLPNLNCKGL